MEGDSEKKRQVLKASKEKIVSWKRNRRVRAYSKVGTPDYMVRDDSLMPLQLPFNENFLVCVNFK